ncbi:Tannase/feruloyl esterase [Diplogelasinospora grovesii]|uniref:Carboxylic ester hydrolase n=1 Tax=Diplogelasinospora grovesii TaxID=303347 RepID=A0AAN6S589_9PEZI|nr:Tannase/feruloyl esterase [Diplogelasinospora grovesii]
MARCFINTVPVTVFLFELLSLLALRGAWAAAAAKQQQLKCAASSFASILQPAGAVLEKIASVPEGGSYGEGAAADVAYPTNPTNLPALCALTVRVASSKTTSYRFGLFLPTTAGRWEGKFLAVGNGGFAGGINWLDMAPGPHYGMATISTDLGHNSTVADLSWALRSPGKKTDWGWRALHGSIVLGKQLTEAFYGGRKISYSYYNGCSTGGRQGLRELQAFPDSFDGALVGAAAWWTTHLNDYVTRLGMYNLPVASPGHISTSDMGNLADEVVRQCDAADGVSDGIVSSPELCTFDFSRMLCGDQNPGVDGAACLNAQQIQTAQHAYADYHSSVDGRFLYPGLTLSSEDQWFILLGGTEPSPFGVGYQRYFLFDNPDWDWHDYNDSIVDFAERTDPGQATAAEFDIHEYKDRGGKIIMYHGLADGLVPTKGSEYYYNQTITTFGGLEKTTDFFRLFLIPGMQHCWGTPVDAPWNIAGAFQPGSMSTSEWSVPGYKDSKHDALMALMDWVEKGSPVDEIVATTWKSSMDPTSGVLRQRPLCPWPAKAVYNGKGDVNVSSSWSCLKTTTGTGANSWAGGGGGGLGNKHKLI